MNSTGAIKMSKDLSIDIKNRRVIIVEDIIDSGLSIKYLYEHIIKYKPKDITIVSLLAKTNNYKLNFNIDIIGFELSSEFVVGYGLDFNQRFRNLKSIFGSGRFKGIRTLTQIHLFSPDPAFFGVRLCCIYFWRSRSTESSKCCCHFQVCWYRIF